MRQVLGYLVVFALLGLGIYAHSCDRVNHSYTVKDAFVNRVDTKIKHESSVYMFYTDKGVFENTDEIAAGKFNSSDVTAQVQAGNTYDFVCVGKRNRRFSIYPNVLSVTLKKSKEEHQRDIIINNNLEEGDVNITIE